MSDGGCEFVDHMSGFVHVVFQAPLNSHETLKAKDEYESICQYFGGLPQQYQPDSSTVPTRASAAEKLKQYARVIKVAGAGAYHHNRVARRAIGVVMAGARTTMLHAAIHWPDMADPQLWSMAVEHAVFSHNHVPRIKSGLWPINFFGRTFGAVKIHVVHGWGCPVNVLDKMLFDVGWSPLSKRTIYLGTSPRHASTVPLMMNSDSRAINAQFHVVFDELVSNHRCDQISSPRPGRICLVSQNTSTKRRREWVR